MTALRSATPGRLNAASLFGGKGADQRRLWQCVSLYSDVSALRRPESERLLSSAKAISHQGPTGSDL
jgi:hypothetical protein